jgi:hypothetical protein
MRNKWIPMTAVALAMTCMLLPARTMRAQEPGEQAVGPRRFAGMQRVSGEITAVSGSTLTVKNEEGTTFQVVTTDNTRVMKGRGVTVKVSDLKVGDGLMAVGNMDEPNKTLHAAMVFATDAAELQKLRENLGKTYIAGKVKSIDMDNARMTVELYDGRTQTIGFDETTSFRRGRVGRGGEPGGDFGGGGGRSRQNAGPETESGENSITLADIKVGDNVRGQGSVKNGVFVPTVLTVATPGEHHHHGEDGGPAGPPPAGPGSN